MPGQQQREDLERGHQLLIDIWGADHHGYMARLKVGVQALGHAPEDLEIILGQLVTLLRGGEQVRLSKRAGEIVRNAGGGEVRTHRPNGQIRNSDTVGGGNDPFPRATRSRK